VRPYYEHGGVTIYHGDCREILPTLPPVDLVLADPPYGIRSVKRDGKMGGGEGRPNRKWKNRRNGVYLPVYGDDKELRPRWLCGYGRRQIVWGAEHFTEAMPRGRMLIWDKRGDLPSNDFSDAELAWDSERGACRIFRHRQMGMVGDGYGDIDRCHPNQKPLALMAWCLSLAPDAASMCDPYMGSGTSLRAAKNRGLRAIGIEIEERYCEIAAKRLSQEVLPLVTPEVA
jgi:site-specific DNA-methyltransferase (adenine-specific)